ncbi:MAG: sugar transferase [Deltaproteobacteria bacterium]|nr:sugar transferase [Deltaproteobacteria bacterium]
MHSVRHVKITQSTSKRLLDIGLSLIGLVFLSPIWLAIAIAILFEDGRPVFYRQLRIGKGGRPFEVIKFRSMVKDAEKFTGPILASENDPRVTKVGKFLRATALDELPQLLNILRGEMSFVGPRPERPELIEKIKEICPAFSKRHAVKPGLTGLAQVYGSYDTPPHRKLKYDLLYIRKWSFCLDLKLIFLSLVVTIKGKWECRGKKFPRKKISVFQLST